MRTYGDFFLEVRVISYLYHMDSFLVYYQSRLLANFYANKLVFLRANLTLSFGHPLPNLLKFAFVHLSREKIIGFSIASLLALLLGLFSFGCGGVVCARPRIERSGFEPWPGTLCCVLRQDT